MHNEVWGCAEILLASFPCATASFKILEFFLAYFPIKWFLMDITYHKLGVY